MHWRIKESHWVITKISLGDIHTYILVISHYKDDVVITRDQGRAEVECNKNDII